MYRLLIVDDEAEIVDWLHDAFMEQDLVELEVYKAYHAKEALNLLDRYKFDVVLTDIRMPDITGIQLMEIIKANWPRCIVIFLSGYQEFDYVYTAIQNQGVRYLLKTENDQKIIGTVVDAIREIESGLNMEDIVTEARHQMLKALPLIQNEYLQDLVTGFQDPKDITSERFMELGIPLDASGTVILAMARIDGITQRSALVWKDKLFCSLKGIADKLLPSDMDWICFTEHQHTLAWLLQPRCPDESAKEEKLSDEFWEKASIRLHGSLEEIQDTFRNTLGATVSFALHTKPSRMASVHERYNTLGRLFLYRTGMTKEMILTEKYLTNKDVGRAFAGDRDFRESYRQMSRLSGLENLLEAGQKDEFMTQLSRTIDGLKNVKSRSFAPALEIYYNVAVLLLSFINRRGFEEAILAGFDLHKLMRIDDHGSWDDAADYLVNLSSRLFDIQSTDEKKRQTDVVLRLQQYISSHLQENLSLTRLADMVHLNSTYLSRLYKETAEKNLSEYILEMRIEKAKSLLAMTSRKVGEIAAETGYDSSQSFSRFFKHSVGVAPLEFRESTFRK
jgi:two-component system response regulator YesN